MLLTERGVTVARPRLVGGTGSTPAVVCISVQAVEDVGLNH
jgi:hypothetical protein